MLFTRDKLNISWTKSRGWRPERFPSKRETCPGPQCAWISNFINIYLLKYELSLQKDKVKLSIVRGTLHQNTTHCFLCKLTHQQHLPIDFLATPPWKLLQSAWCTRCGITAKADSQQQFLSSMIIWFLGFASPAGLFLVMLTKDVRDYFVLPVGEK